MKITAKNQGTDAVCENSHLWDQALQSNLVGCKKHD